MGEKLPDGECYREGIRYGHEWICHMVKLVKAAADTGMALGCQWDDLVWTGSLAVRVGQRTVPVPVEMVKEPYGEWRWVIAIG